MRRRAFSTATANLFGRLDSIGYFKLSASTFLDEISKAAAATTCLPKPSRQVSKKLFQHLMRAQLTTRIIDLAMKSLYKSGDGFYRIESMGHEGMAAVASCMTLNDPKLMHNRSAAAFVERMLDAQGDPIEEILRSVVGSAQSFSGGTHKSFGDLRAGFIPQTSTVASQIPKAVGLAFSLELARRLQFDTPFPKDAIVLCSFGDGAFNHGSAQEALNFASLEYSADHAIPLLLVCENNGVSISTKNKSDYVAERMLHHPGFDYMQADGCDIFNTLKISEKAVSLVRKKRSPVFLDLHTVRFSPHYIGEDMIVTGENDPVMNTIVSGIKSQYMTFSEINSMFDEIISSTILRMRQVINEPKVSLPDFTKSTGHAFALTVSPSFSKSNAKGNTLAEKINTCLKQTLKEKPHALVLGDDVANDIGGPYGVTKDLKKMFEFRVFNMPVAETSILSTAQMLGLSGFLPIVEIRHLAYIHNAIDQLRGEASTTRWVSGGKYKTPFLLRIPGLSYQAHGGHFHNDASTASLRDITGVSIACLSDPATAESLYHQCISQCQEMGDIVILLEPIALYKQTSFDYLGPQYNIYPGIQVYGDSTELSIISYGNGLEKSLLAARALQQEGVEIRVIDLQWLKPLPITSLLSAIQNTPNILIVDEARETCSVSKEVSTKILEHMTTRHNVKRMTSPDLLIPLGPASMRIFPSEKKILQFIRAHFLQSSSLAPSYR